MTIFLWSVNQLLNIHTGCPEGWFEFQSSCYFVEKGRKNKTEGAKICRAKGGTLPVIKSLEENNFLLKLTENYTRDHNLELDPWLGMEAPGGDNHFFWDDKTPVTITFWNNGEPNEPKTEKCAYMYLKNQQKQKKGMWNNNPCRYPRLIICQTKK